MDDDVPFFDDAEAAQGAIILRSQIAQLEINAVRQGERLAVETLCQDAMRRHAEVMQKGDFQKATEALREIVRLEFYLSKRGLV